MVFHGLLGPEKWSSAMELKLLSLVKITGKMIRPRWLARGLRFIVYSLNARFYVLAAVAAF